MPGMELDAEVEDEAGIPMPAIEEWEELELPHAARAMRPATVGTSTSKRTRLIERMRMKTFR
jgi:hypothetical protein